MINSRIVVKQSLVLIFLIKACIVYSQSPEMENKFMGYFVNDICLPSTLYMLSDTQNDVFVEPLIKRWRPYNDVVRFSGSTLFLRRLSRVVSVSQPRDGDSLVVDLINQDEFRTIKTLTSTISVGKPGIGHDTVRVSIIGDSFTHGAFFKDALLEKEYVPKIKMIGLREVNGHPGQFDEGRGGWTVNSYCKVSNQANQAYNGFWQPNGKARYWGSTEFWKLVHNIHDQPDTIWSFGEKYNTSRFYSHAIKYDRESGYKLRPEVDDLMYDNSLESYVIYDGKQWKLTQYDNFEWDFKYGKYLAMWKQDRPDILVEFLGLNDFRNAPDPGSIDFTTWNAQLEKIIDSYFRAVPEGKFVLMIPSSTCGILDNKAGDFTTKQNANMWEVRNNIIVNFDHRQAENIYIVDGGIAIDNTYGTRFLSDSVFTLPYFGYKGDTRINVQTGNPHPYENYPNMGVSLAGFIQKYRK